MGYVRQMKLPLVWLDVSDDSRKLNAKVSRREIFFTRPGGLRTQDRVLTILVHQIFLNTLTQ